MKLAKPTEQDFNAVLELLNACELALESNKYAMNNPEDEWEDLDDDDESKVEILRIRKRIADEEGKSENCIDNRIVMYEFLKAKFRAADCSWRRVYWAGEILHDNVCDPTESHVAFYPAFEFLHVANEQ